MHASRDDGFSGSLHRDRPHLLCTCPVALQLGERAAGLQRAHRAHRRADSQRGQYVSSAGVQHPRKVRRHRGDSDSALPAASHLAGRRGRQSDHGDLLPVRHALLRHRGGFGHPHLHHRQREDGGSRPQGHQAVVHGGLPRRRRDGHGGRRRHAAGRRARDSDYP